MGVLFIETAVDVPFSILAERHLDFVPVMEGIFHPHAGGDIHIHVADLLELLPHFRGFVFELSLVGKLLKAASPAGVADFAFRRDALRGYFRQGFDFPEQNPRAAIDGLHLAFFAREHPFNEDDVGARFENALSLKGKIDAGPFEHLGSHPFHQAAAFSFGAAIISAMAWISFSTSRRGKS